MNDGTTPLFIASQHGHVDVVRALMEEGQASTRLRMKGAPLFMASQEAMWMW